MHFPQSVLAGLAGKSKIFNMNNFLFSSTLTLYFRMMMQGFWGKNCVKILVKVLFYKYILEFLFKKNMRVLLLKKCHKLQNVQCEWISNIL